MHYVLQQRVPHLNELLGLFDADSLLGLQDEAWFSDNLSVVLASNDSFKVKFNRASVLIKIEISLSCLSWLKTHKFNLLNL